MIIQSLKEHFPARFAEWFLAGMLVTWGLYVLFTPSVFTHPVSGQMLVGLADMTSGTGTAPHIVWGFSAFVIGAGRAIALFVNGAYFRTPAIRVVASFFSAFIWTQVFVGMFNSGIPYVGMTVYGWLIIADLASAYRASRDMVVSEKQRRDFMEIRRRVGIAAG